MGYCYMHIEKVKSFVELEKKHQHNYREEETINANKLLQHLNKEYINQTNTSWSEVVKQRIYQAQCDGKMGKVRKDAIRAFELLVTMSQEDKDNINIDEWAKANVAWVKKTFNIPGQAENVISAMLHRDENGCPHIHFIIMPFDNKGKLNGSYFVENRYKYIEMQDSYAKAMEKFNLKRGLKNSRAKHEDIKKFYTKLNYTLDQKLPAPEKGESIEQYYERANKQYTEIQMQRFQEQKKAEREVAEYQTNSLNEHLELERLRKSYKKKLKAIEKFCDSITEEAIESGEAIKDVEQNLKEYNTLKQAMKNYPDKKVTNKLSDKLKKIYDWELAERESKKLEWKNYEIFDNTER